MANIRLTIVANDARSAPAAKIPRNIYWFNTVRRLTATDMVRDPKTGMLYVKELTMPGGVK